MHHERLSESMTFPPETPQPNVYPLSWRAGTEKLEEVWDAAQREYWDPKKLPWDTFDPDSYSWEEREAMAYIRRIDELGGMLRAIDVGFPQKEIADAAYVYQQQIDRGEKVVVGMNRYQVPEERPPELLRVPLEVEARQVERVRRFKESRNGRAAYEARLRVHEAAAGGANLMPPLVEAVKAGCTVGELCDVYREVFGEYRDPGWV